MEGGGARTVKLHFTFLVIFITNILNQFNAHNYVLSLYVIMFGLFVIKLDNLHSKVGIGH